MTKGKWPKNRATLGQQIAQMRRRFPGFRHARQNGTHAWTGQFRPTSSSPSYTVRIEWRQKKEPRAYVTSPALHPKAPHRYADGSLCLFDPHEWRWRESDLISETIAPWAAEWLYWYEIWLETGKWFAAEAGHDGPKKRDSVS